ncbi:hypothetical protein QBC34DRAFT_147372 [Podospora aff. communis PSN243]|uniref:Uncharacterized protein n=1 Tax=Podospora aff. communis PSN243 TaxID=3040156 RepID=A0AAV9GH37_9PEZI|nr:hypothetical protein QBC34DRAFT_147372 [Podospora aff. communis PSN243]
MADATESIRLGNMNPANGDFASARSETGHEKNNLAKSTSHLITSSASNFNVPSPRSLLTGPSTLFFLSNILIIAIVCFFTSILAFTIFSESHDGILIIRRWTYLRSTGGDAFSGLSLLWTALPTLVFSLLGFLMGWVFKDVIELTPFLELYRGPVRGDRSAVLVDYRTESRLWVVPRALRRGHWLVAMLTVAMLLYAAVVVPLSSHLFDTRLRSLAEVHENGARQVTSFSPGRLSAEADYGRAMEVASAREVYGGGGGEFARWMTKDYIFPTFSAAGRAWPENSTVTIQGVTGYTAELDECDFIEPDKYRMSEAGRASNVTANETLTTPGGRTVSLNGADGGCLIKLDLQVDDGKFDLYFGSGVYQCPEGQKEGLRPPVFFVMAWPAAASGSSSPLALSTRVFSCRPRYQIGIGSLSISTAGSELTINSFNNISSTNHWSPQTGFEKAILTTASTSASAAGSRARVQTTAFGNLVLGRFDITQRDPAKPWTENDVDTEKELRVGLIESAQTIFKSVILSSLSTMALDESKWPLGTKENLRTATTDIDVEKLFVFFPVAVLILAALFVLFFLAIGASMASREMRNSQCQLPANLLAYHGLLQGCNDLHQVAVGVYEPNPKREFAEAAKKQWTVKTALFHVEVDGARRRLHAQGLQWRGGAGT